MDVSVHVFVSECMSVPAVSRACLGGRAECAAVCVARAAVAADSQPRFKYGDGVLVTHITADSPAVDLGAGNFLLQIAALGQDFDKQTRPNGLSDAGADEYSLTAPTGDPGSPGPSGDLVGPSLVIASHTNSMAVSGATVTRSEMLRRRRYAHETARYCGRQATSACMRTSR